jgi:hypothetical protein
VSARSTRNPLPLPYPEMIPSLLPYVEIDLRQVSGPRWILNVAGHGARPDIFHLPDGTWRPTFSGETGTFLLMKIRTTVP